MHKKIIEHASETQVREFLTDTITMLKSVNPDLYEELEDSLYCKVYGPHFNEWLLEEAVADMINEDGTTGPHWTLTDTNNVVKSSNYTLAHYNEYDWNYVMNMLYSDYYTIGGSDTSFYTKLAYKFLTDKDAAEGKAFKYYRAVSE